MTGNQIKTRSFSLLRWFSLGSLLCIALIGVSSALIMTRFLTDNMLVRDAEISSEFVASIVQAEAAWTYFTWPDRSSNPSIAARVDAFLRRFSELPDVVRANVYARDRRVIWSSAPEIVGRRFNFNAELEESFAGKLTVDTGVVGAQNDKSEHVAFDESQLGMTFIETYIPVWSRDHKEVIGVVEIYKLPPALLRAIARGKQLVWMTALLGGLLLFATLFWIVHRANRVIHDQQRQLILAETMTAMGEMASAVAHSIRNALASIRSSAELALDDDPAGAREAAADIIGETDRLDKWVRDLLAYARSDNSATEAVDLARVIRSNLQGFATALSRHNIAIAVATEDRLPAVRAGAAPLDQALNSLIANAIEAMPDGGELSVVGRLDVGGRAVEVQIRDTGRGLPREAIGAVFRPFFSTKRSGLGLGLALSRRIVERYGGTLDLTSVEGQGTTVTMRLPAAA